MNVNSMASTARWRASLQALSANFIQYCFYRVSTILSLACEPYSCQIFTPAEQSPPPHPFANQNLSFGPVIDGVVRFARQFRQFLSRYKVIFPIFFHALSASGL